MLTGTKASSLRVAMVHDLALHEDEYYSEDPQIRALLPLFDETRNHLWIERLSKKGVSDYDIQFLLWVLHLDPRQRPSAEDIGLSDHLGIPRSKNGDLNSARQRKRPEDHIQHSILAFTTNSSLACALNLYVCVYESQNSNTESYDYALITGNTDNYDSMVQYNMHSFTVKGPTTKSGELPLKYYNTISQCPPQDILSLILIAKIKDQLFFENTINGFSLEVSTVEEECEDEDDFYGEEYYSGEFEGRFFFLRWAFQILAWVNRDGEVLEFSNGGGWRIDEVVWAGSRFTDMVVENEIIGGMGGGILVYDMA
ncbi:hypothetical protein EAF04_006654 [Stromatinia cepivora]|nr:hypothetical protein EAF04_006654 [Stromatinia cepivora]